MQKFQDLLTQAAQLKQAQLKKQRKNFESLPDYLKAGLNYSKRYAILRTQNYLLQMNISQKLKKQGNNFFKKIQFQQALDRYEQALSIFRFIKARTQENLKDQDLQFEHFILKEDQKQYEQQFNTHLIALYLNICTCLTRLNKKEDAIHSADQALKINQNPKAYYKKAQAYLQYINRDIPDIKLGFFFLNKCYEMSKDQSVLQQMHRIKKEIDQERNKQQKWFKFMFDKNSKFQEVLQVSASEKKSQKQVQQAQQKALQIKDQKLQDFQKQMKGAQIKEDEKLEKTKEKLSKYVNKDMKQDEWLEMYQAEFIMKYGSKIYSILQVYGLKQLFGQYKVMLAQCLEAAKNQSQGIKRRQCFNKYIEWLKQHRVSQVEKYVERYGLQTKWVMQQRKKMILGSQPQKIQTKNITKQKEADQKIQKSTFKVEHSTNKQSQSSIQAQRTQKNQANLQNQASNRPQSLISDNSNRLKNWSFIIALVLIVILKYVF